MDRGKTPETPRGVTIRKYPSGRQVIQIAFSYRGVQCRETLRIPPTRANIKYAERQLATINLEIERKEFRYSNHFPESPRCKKFEGIQVPSHQIGEWFDEIIAYKEAQNILEPSTILTRRKAFDCYIRPMFGQLRVDELTPRLLRNWIKSSGLAITTVKSALTALSYVVTEAIHEQVIQHNPIRDIDWKNLYSRKARHNSKDRIDPFNEHDIAQLIEAARDSNLHCMVQFGFFTGLRLEELMALPWKNVDWENRKVLIDRAYGHGKNGTYLKGTKTHGSERLVDLLPPAFEALQAQRTYTEHLGKEVFLTPRMTHFSRHSMYDHWKRIIKISGLRHRPPKQMRHTFASLMLSRGENIMWVAAMLGHSDLQMLSERYAKWVGQAGQRNYVPVNRW